MKNIFFFKVQNSKATKEWSDNVTDSTDSTPEHHGRVTVTFQKTN